MSDKITKNSEEILPPILFAAKNKAEEAWLARLKKKKRIRSIGPRIYSSLPVKETEKAVRVSWQQIVRTLYPDVLISYRTALEYNVSPNNEIFLTGTTNRSIILPGLHLRFIRGPSPLEDDPTVFGVRASSIPRALLENFSITKATLNRSFPPEQMELYLENLLQAKGETELNKVRDRAKEIADKLGWKRSYIKLDQVIGALLGTRSAGSLKSMQAKARARGLPFDSACLERMDLLFSELKQRPLKEIPDLFMAPDHFRNKAFFEAYFSNYIEGTTFEIEEAEAIIFDRIIPKKRPRDAHDIIGTFHLVSDPNEMNRVPKSENELDEILKFRHQNLMSARPDTSPGEYKDEPNRAGDTFFVKPELVEGSLYKSFERYQELPAGLARAIFMMFMVAEIHPFRDGNGRIARIMMNAELVSKKLSTLIIPTVYREDYLSALRALTRRSRPDPLIRMLVKVQNFSHFEFSPYPKALGYMQTHNWFREPIEAKLIE